MLTPTGRRHLSIKTSHETFFAETAQHRSVHSVCPYESHPQILLRTGLTRRRPWPVEICGQVELRRHRGLPAADRGPASVPGQPETPATSFPFLTPPPPTHQTPAAGATAGARGALLPWILKAPKPACHSSRCRWDPTAVPSPRSSQTASQQPPRWMGWGNRDKHTSANATYSARLMQRSGHSCCHVVSRWSYQELYLFMVMEEKVLQKVLKAGEGDDFVKHLGKAVNSGRTGKCQELRREAGAQDAEVGT